MSAVRRRVTWARVAAGLAVPATLLAAAAGSVLAVAGPAAAGGPAPAAAPCTDTWVGKATQPLWTNAENWSNGVPGRGSDVCITATGDEVFARVSIKIHSLRLGQAEGLALEGNDIHPITATVATSVDLTPGGTSLLSMTSATITAARINDQGGLIFTAGPCGLDSPDVVLGQGARMEAASGTTTLASLPQLSNGTLTDASFSTETSNTFYVLPGDITSLVSSAIDLTGSSAIEDPQGSNALAGLTSVGAGSSLRDDGNLTLTGSGFTADGNVSFGGTVAIAGPYAQAAGTLSLSGNAALTASLVTIGQGAALSGSGIITADLVNDGTAQPAGETTQVTGNYTQGANAVLQSGSAACSRSAARPRWPGRPPSRPAYHRARTRRSSPSARSAATSPATPWA